MAPPRLLLISALGLTLASAACTDDALDSDEAARRLYLGLDGSIEDSLNLGFDGFNAASSANIDPQSAPGVGGGTLTITGQVDQGSSDNKGMRLYVGMVAFSEGVLTIPTADGTDTLTIDLTYDTSATPTAQPYLHLALRNVPTGTFTGELTGLYHVRGDLAGDVTLDLTMAGTLADGGNGTVVRAIGSTTITGTATSGDGVYAVNLTR